MNKSFHDRIEQSKQKQISQGIATKISSNFIHVYVLNVAMNVFLENEYHESCILKNLLDRSTASYLVMREKINYISSMMQKYETKYAKVKLYYKQNNNLLDESNIEK